VEEVMQLAFPCTLFWKKREKLNGGEGQWIFGNVLQEHL